jgi:predicted transcriptional regulator
MTGEKPSRNSITSVKIDAVDGQSVGEGNLGMLGNTSQMFTKLGGKIYRIAQQIMDKHYCINISDLATACFRSIKSATKRDILDEIHRLKLEKFLFNGNALTGTSVLKNLARNEVLDAIATSPGINFSRLRYATGKGNHLLAWHLSVLEKFAYIRSATIDGSLAYFPKGAPPDHDVLNAFLNKPGLKEILNLFMQLGKLRTKDIEFALKLPHATAFRRLRKLIDHGFVQDLADVEREAIWYEINPAWIEPIRGSLMGK